MVLTFVLAGCEREEPQQTVSMPITISLMSNDVMSARNAMPVRRAIGDPGTSEQFLFPHRLYILIMRQKPDESWELWHTIERTLTDGDWTPRRYGDGPFALIGDSIYQYNDHFDLLLDNGTLIGRQEFVGRVFAIVSAEELEFDKNLDDTGIQNLNDALTLKFNTASIQDKLQHIYATPYNYVVGGKYYGEFSSITEKVPKLDLLLYHVAAKVDIKWSVAESLRINKTDPSQAIRLTYMQAKNLFNGDAYCFKPMENTEGSKLTSGYSRDIIRSTPDYEGMWWEGRTYFYTIPYSIEETGVHYFPLQMVLKTNGSTTDGYRPTLNMKVDTDSPFVPWMRANFNISASLTDGEVTKNINNN